MKSDFIWRNGEMIPFSEATVHILNPTMHYGPGVFEGIRCYETPRGPAVFRLIDHLARFIESIKILGFENLPYNAPDLQKAVHQTIQVNGFSECYIRPFMYLEGPMGLNLDSASLSFAVAAWEWGPYLGEEVITQGARMMVSSFTRMHPNAGMTKGKIGGQYVNSMLAKTLALRLGMEEAVLLDPDGYVTEGTGENLFLVKDNVIYTPQLDNALRGLTRDAVIRLAQDLGYKIIEKRMSRDELYIADEIFVTGTAVEVAPIREVDFRTVGSGTRGPVTKQIQDAFHDTVHGRGARSAEYLDYLETVPGEPEALAVAP